MGSLIELMSEFADRMMNPVFGAGQNEEYALRLARAVDGNFDERLAAEVGRLDTTSALTPYGWSWLLRWAKNTGTQMSPEILLRLCEEWESSTFKAQIIDVATYRSGYESRDVAVDVREFPNEWLRQIMTRAITDVQNTADSSDDSPSSGSSRHAQSLLIALIFVESDLTLAAASALLNQQWYGQAATLDFFWGRTDILDLETRTAWVEILRPPSRG